MTEHYDPSVPSDERRQFAEWFAICLQTVNSSGRPDIHQRVGHFDVEEAVAALEAQRKA